VAVEANPQLCAGLRARWADAIAAGRLVVVNAVLTAEPDRTEAEFYLHRTDHQLSQHPRPLENPGAFTRVLLPALGPGALVAQYGEPYYFKTDVEYHDAAVLTALFAAGHRPPYVSAEYHSAAVFGALAGAGGYDAFQVVEASEVPRRFAHHPIATADGTMRWRFALHATGPFGPDLPGPWYRSDDFLRALALADLSWADIHAARADRVTLAPPVTLDRAALAYLARRVSRRLARRVIG
jgi:hypothetical protein